MSIESPLVIGSTATLVQKIPCAVLIEGYRREYSIDVSDYFTDLSDISIYECQTSGFRFYHPSSTAGKEGLYQELQRFDWNYKSEKWEYDRALQSITRGSSILDVGCGEGAFLTLAQRSGLTARGLELNSSAASKATASGLTVSVQSIGEHAASYPEHYDAVCSFQVMEHIPDVRPFITDCIRCLKPGGKLIFGVPNNDGFLKYADAVLNAPPHHMGLWTRKSLEALTSIFNLQLTTIENEPLSEIDWYVAVMERRYLRSKLLKAAFYRSGLSDAVRLLISSQRKKIKGHTILAFYQKKMP